MKTVLTNLSNKLYEASRIKLNASGVKFGIDQVISYDFDDLKGTAFYNENQKTLSQSRGLGYWIWKPYIILEAMKDLQENDVVIYSDCGIEIIDKLDPLLAICSTQPVMLFANGNLKNRLWTKRDCFIKMGCDDLKYWNGLQCDAAFSLYRKSKESILFLKEWLHYCCDGYSATDEPNRCGKKNFFGFRQHRWDQSVLSLLAIKHDIVLHRVPTQFGNHYKSVDFRKANEFNCINQLNQRQLNYYSKSAYENSPYFQLLNHHRSKHENSLEKKEKIPVPKRILISGVRRLRKIVRLISRT